MKNIIVIFLAYIMLGGYAINELAIGETLIKDIRVQIRPIYEVENKKQDGQLNSNHYRSSHIKYQEVENLKINDELKKTFSEQVQPVEYDKVNISSINDTICQNIKKKLSTKSILSVESEPDIIIEIAIKKTTFDSLYGPRPIADIVTYKGKYAANDKVIFSGEFMQNYNFPFGSIKTPEQIGTILAKKIAKEIKKLNR